MHIQYIIGGIHCSSCILIIEKHLATISGIIKANVQLATNTAHIDYDEKIIQPSDIIKEIVSLGYTIKDSNTGSNTAKTQTKDEQRTYLIGAIISFVLSIPVALTMFMTIPHSRRFDGLLMISGAIVIYGAGWSFHVGAYKKLMHMSFTMDSLISISTNVAYAYAIYAIVSIYMFDTTVHYFHFLEGASFIVSFLLLGKYLETKTKGQASQAIQKLMDLQTKDAIVLIDGKEAIRPIEQINIGDILICKPGSKIPFDGVISKGSAHIDESFLTGESIPAYKDTGDQVYAGTIVGDKSINISVTTLPGQSRLGQIIASVDAILSSKAPIQKQIDRITAVFVPIVICLSILAFGLHYLGYMQWVYDFFGQDISNMSEHAMLVLVTTVVIACPCAMGLATPMAITVASGTGAKNGVLLKSTETLEKSQNIDTVVFDKTGTLTLGRPKVIEMVWYNGSKDTQSDMIQQKKYTDILGHITTSSLHPLSQAVNNHVGTLSSRNINDIQEIPGKGLMTTHNNTQYRFGNMTLMQEANIQIDQSIIDQSIGYQKNGYTVNYFSEDTKIIGLIVIGDTLHPEAKDTIKKLQKMGKKIVMLSGDTHDTVASIAQQLNIQNFIAQVLPTEKGSHVLALQSLGEKVAFVGDGINDAPALVQADLGIAMGGGSDIAIESGDIVLTTNNPAKVVLGLRLASKTYTIIKQNLFRAFAYNTILIPIAALGLLMPRFAGVAMSVSSISVVLNSLRLQHIKE